MDIVEITRRKAVALGDGSFSLGLKAVLAHIETAIRHLERGQKTLDETAFTDTIYRTNQAFEGSLKEAYKVFTDKESERITPNQIENYIQENDILKPRVLQQFTNYRQEWRNPSTHDYTLNFDESEAFLAIVSVCAFTNVLIDQISQHIAFENASQVSGAEKAEIRKHIVEGKNLELLDKVTELFQEFVKTYDEDDSSHSVRENELLGALTGFLSVIAPELNTTLEVSISKEPRRVVDLIISDGTSEVLIELKVRYSRGLVDSGISQMAKYIEASGIKNAILFIYHPPSKILKRTIRKLPEQDTEVVVLSPLHLDLN